MIYVLCFGFIFNLNICRETAQTTSIYRASKADIVVNRFGHRLDNQLDYEAVTVCKKHLSQMLRDPGMGTKCHLCPSSRNTRRVSLMK